MDKHTQDLVNHLAPALHGIAIALERPMNKEQQKHLRKEVLDLEAHVNQQRFGPSKWP